MTICITDDRLIEVYEQTQSIRETGRRLGMSHETARYKLKRLNKINKPIRYTCNDNYFSQNTVDVFYWAGFIAADGCVKLHNGKYKQLQIGLAYKDHRLLEKFKSAIGFDGQIRKYAINTGSTKSEISIISDKLFDDLARFNIVPRKSLIYTFPEWLIGHPLVNHFMRGYNDGDGSFYCSVNKKTGRKIKQLYFSLRGTKKFLEVFDSILKSNCGFDKDKKPRLNSGIYTLEFGGTRKVGKVRDFLYKDSTKNTRLDRKYNLAHDDAFVNIPKSYRLKPVVGTNIETKEEIMLNSIKDGERFGFLRQGISACCRGKSAYHKGYTWKYA